MSRSLSISPILDARALFKRAVVACLAGFAVVMATAGCAQSSDSSAEESGILAGTTTTAPTVSSTTTTEPEPDPFAGRTSEPPPTIVFDDSEADRIWFSPEEGQTPEEFSPDVLTRAELVEFEPLSDPIPYQWNAPRDGIDEAYAERVVRYLDHLERAVLAASVSRSPDDPRVLAAIGSFAADQAQLDIETVVAAISSERPPEFFDWSPVEVDDLTLVEVGTLWEDKVPCMKLAMALRWTHPTLGEQLTDVVRVYVQDASSWSINPSDWRLFASAVGTDPNLVWSCD